MTDARQRLTTPLRAVARWALGVFLIAAGTGHLLAPDEFLAQVPAFLPWPDAIVLISGLLEIALGLALVLLPRHRVVVGWIVAAFFIAIVPGNIYQAVTGTTAFGLESDTARWSRLAFQPLFVAWALWACAAVRDRDLLPGWLVRRRSP